MGHMARKSHKSDAPHAPNRRWMRFAHTRAGHTACMLLLIPLYAACFVVIRSGLAYASPLRAAATRRLLIAGGAFLLVGMTRQPLRIHRQMWPWLVVLALTAGAVGYTTMFLSPGRAGAGTASVLGNTAAHPRRAGRAIPWRASHMPPCRRARFRPGAHYNGFALDLT